MPLNAEANGDVIVGHGCLNSFSFLLQTSCILLGGSLLSQPLSLLLLDCTSRTKFQDTAVVTKVEKTPWPPHQVRWQEQQALPQLPSTFLLGCFAAQNVIQKLPQNQQQHQQQKTPTPPPQTIKPTTKTNNQNKQTKPKPTNKQTENNPNEK